MKIRLNIYPKEKTSSVLHVGLGAGLVVGLELLSLSAEFRRGGLNKRHIMFVRATLKLDLCRGRRGPRRSLCRGWRRFCLQHNTGSQTVKLHATSGSAAGTVGATGSACMAQ